jgi:hypothetical protein
MAYHATLSAVLTAVVRVLNDQRIEYALADRSQDRADIEGMLARYETTLDRVYLGRWAERLGLAPGGVGGA